MYLGGSKQRRSDGTILEHFQLAASVWDRQKKRSRTQVLYTCAARGTKYCTPRKRGYSKNGRHDTRQIVVGLAVGRDELPVRHRVFPGNNLDVTTVEPVKADPRGWRLGR